MSGAFAAALTAAAAAEPAARWLAVLPEAVVAAVGALIFVALVWDRHRDRWARRAARCGAPAIVLACLLTLGQDAELLWLTYRVDAFSQYVKLAVAGGFWVSVLAARDGAGQRDDARAETFFFLLTATFGLMVIASAVEALALYVALEMAAASLYVLVPLREGFRRSEAASRRFLLVGLTASVVALYGLSILIGLTGTTRLDEMAAALPALAGQPAALLGLGLFLSGFLFKLALFPYHSWAPDVYEGASHGVAAYLATASTVAAVALLVRLLALTQLAGTSLAVVLALAAAVSMTLGNLAALVQRDVKRVLAYSAVAQAGYIVVGLVAFTRDGYAAALFYGVLYLLMNAAAFLVVARVGADGANVSLDDLGGLHRRAPLLAATLLLALLALAGVPPTSGFVGKLILFRAAAEEGWWWLVLLGAANATISAVFFLAAIRRAYLLPAAEERPLALTTADRVACCALSAATLVLGVWPTPLYDLAVRVTAQLP